MERSGITCGIIFIIYHIFNNIFYNIIIFTKMLKISEKYSFFIDILDI